MQTPFHLWLLNARSNEKCINCFGSITKHRLQNQPNTNMVQLTSSHKKLTELFLKLFEEKMFLFYTLNAIRKFSLKKGYPFTGVEDQTITGCKARQIPIQFNFLVLGFFNGNFSWHANWCINVEVSFSDSLICPFN